MQAASHALLKLLQRFASGATASADFEHQLYTNAELEALLTASEAPRHASSGHTLFHYLIALAWQRPEAIHCARHEVANYLQSLGLAPAAPAAADQTMELLYAAQPAWLDADLAYLEQLLQSAPEGTPAQRKTWLKQQIKQQFRSLKRPPQWLQTARWPMGVQGRPMVFLGQMAVDDYFHDHSAVYLFHDPDSDAITSIRQSA